MLSALSGAPITSISSPVAVLTSTPLCTSALHPLGRKRSRSVMSSRNEPTPCLLQALFRRGVFVDLAAFARPCDTSLRLLTRRTTRRQTHTHTGREERYAAWTSLVFPFRLALFVCVCSAHTHFGYHTSDQVKRKKKPSVVKGVRASSNLLTSFSNNNTWLNPGLDCSLLLLISMNVYPG